jgi:drug/metabolite transporter (DMT)-like permease
VIYTLASLALWITRRPPPLGRFSPRYLLVAGGLLVFYEAAVGLSLGLAANAAETIQIGVVNYLWPTLTVLLSVILARGRGVGRQVVPGMLLGTVGIARVVGGSCGRSRSSSAPWPSRSGSSGRSWWHPRPSSRWTQLPSSPSPVRPQ